VDAGEVVVVVPDHADVRAELLMSHAALLAQRADVLRERR